jgi:microcystin-dependent protein
MSEPFLGQVMAVPYAFAPKGWSFSLGQLLPVNQNMALFSLLGTVFGGNGTSNFALPNLGGRVVIGADGRDFPLGATGGSDQVTLTLSQLPSHNHAAMFSSPGGASPATFDVSASFTAPVSVSGSLMANSAKGSDDNPSSGCTLGSVSVTSTRIYAASSGAAVPLAAITSTGTVSGTLNSPATGTTMLPAVTGSVSVAAAGAGLPLPTMPPYLALNPIIALQGIFPTRQ